MVKNLDHSLGRKNSLSTEGLAGLNSFCGLQGTGAVPHCLVPDPGVIRAGGSGPGSESPIMEVSRTGLWTGWLVCERCSYRGFICCLTNWHTLGGAVSPQPASLQDTTAS